MYHLQFKMKLHSLKYTLVILFVVMGVFAHHKAVAQTLSAEPMVKNYPKQVYKGGTQTWDISEGDNGLIYFANNNGLILFDGKQFNNFPLPKNTILRSILFDPKSKRIYAGGQNEIGYFEITPTGKLEFNSLTSLLPPGNSGFEDVWGIKSFEGKIFFQTRRQIFIYTGKTFQEIKPSEFVLQNIFTVNNRLLLTDAAGGIYERKNGGFELLLRANDLDVSSILPYKNNGLLITTYKNGLYILSNNQLLHPEINDAVLRSNRIYRACTYGSYYVLASNRGGIFFLDSTLQIINNIGVKEGLQNNNILCLLKDKNGNVWLGLDNGIDLVRLNYPFGYVIPDGLLKGTGYCMVESLNNYYFGTNNGFYFRSKQNHSSNGFQLVANTEGQVWWAQDIHGKIFVSHHEGLFEIDGALAKRISTIQGCWKMIPLKKYPGYYLMGTYDGLNLFKWENNSLTFSGKLGPFKESSRFLEEDEAGNIWVGHPYKGIYRLRLSADLKSIQQVKHYGIKDGLPSETENYVFNCNQGIVFCTAKGLYEFRDDKKRFELSGAFAPLTDSLKTLKRVINGQNGNIWFVAEQEIFCLKPAYNGMDYSFTKLPMPKLDQNLVGGFEYLYETTDGTVFLGLEAGFAEINASQISNFVQTPPNVLITAIQSLSIPDSVYYRYIQANGDKLTISDRSIEFAYSSPNANFFADLSFSSYLEGWDKSWSVWKPGNSREYSQLSDGDYTFHVKAKYMGLEGPETIVKIHIPAPWYWTKYARMIYSLLLILIVLIIGFYPQMLVRKKAIKIIAEKDDHFKKQTSALILEKEKQEKELIELRNQQLQKEVEHQGKELASSTMHIVQKSEMLMSIKDKLKHISQISNDPKIKPEISELIKNIEKDTLIDKDWGKFELYFNNIHDSYTKSLKERFPVLTANDIKMCAYLRMNLSTKEISTILNISTRGVEISRYRLRKKMGLENGVNLSDYLSKI